MVTSKDLRDTCLRSSYAVVFIGVYTAAVATLVLYFVGRVEAAALEWIPFATVGALVLGAAIAHKKRPGLPAEPR